MSIVQQPDSYSAVPPPVRSSVNRASSGQTSSSSGPVPEAKLDLIALFYRTQHQPILNASVLLLDIFQSEDYFKKLTALKEADLNKFLKLAQLQCRLPNVSVQTLRIMQHYILKLQIKTSSSLPLEASSTELSETSKAPVATGGASTIFRGQWLGQETVAIKKLKIPVVYQDLKNLRKEVSVLRQMKHRSVVPIYGFSFVETDEKRPFIVLPWMASGSAHLYLKNHPQANRIRILDQVSSALSYLHSAGVVHGDLKGDNILLDERLDAYLSDFGNCVVVEDVLSLEPAGTTFLGAVRWTAPERLEGGPNTENTDIFAFACTCLELITDLPPFLPKISSELLVNKAVRKGDRPSMPSKMAVRGLDDRFWKLIQKMWSHKPKDRPCALVVREEMRKIRKIHETGLNASSAMDLAIMTRNGGAPRSPLSFQPKGVKASSRKASKPDLSQSSIYSQSSSNSSIHLSTPALSTRQRSNSSTHLASPTISLFPSSVRTPNNYVTSLPKSPSKPTFLHPSPVPINPLSPTHLPPDILCAFAYPPTPPLKSTHLSPPPLSTPTSSYHDPRLPSPCQ